MFSRSTPARRIVIALAGAFVFCLPPASGPARAETDQTRPPRQIRLVETRFDELDNQEIEPMGKTALDSFGPWKHAQTENFIVHYRRTTEAHRAVREIEYNLWFIAKTLGAGPERYAKKSHVYIFSGEQEWKEFLAEVHAPSWSGSFAYGDHLFLHIGGFGETFDSHTLAHETTHAVVARLYPDKKWPLWLSEGFAEYMAGAAIASRKGQYIKGYQRDLGSASRLGFKELMAIHEYPSAPSQVLRLYRSSERVIRFLMTRYPKDRIARFVESILAGNDFQKTVLEVYGDKGSGFAEFEKRYNAFEK